MSRYFSVFLCGSRWADPEQVLTLLDWLATLPSLGSKLALIAREKVGDSQKPSLRGNLHDWRPHLNEKRYETLSVSDGEWGISGSKLYFYFENIVSPSAIASFTNDVNILTISIRSDVWSLYQHSSIPADLFAQIEMLFANLNCLYGYADRTEHIIASRYSQIRSTQAARLRIIDFDYAHYIEGIYQRNYLSNQIVTNLSVDLCNKLKSFSEAVECKAIHDVRGMFKGIAIYITRAESSEVQRLQELLNPVIWRK